MVTFQHPRRRGLQGNDRVALKTVFSDPKDPFAPISIVPVDVETGEVVPERVDAMTQMRQRQKAEKEALRASFQAEINAARPSLERPWLDTTPNPRKYYAGETGKQVLSEFVPGGQQPALDTTTPLPVRTQNLSVGDRPSQEFDISAVPVGFPGMPASVNVLPPGQSLAWAQANGMVTPNAEPLMTSGPILPTLNSDIPGVVYANAAEDLIAMAKAQGSREAFLDMQVTSDSTSFAEFRALMTEKGVTVNINDIAFGPTGPEYRVSITW